MILFNVHFYVDITSDVVQLHEYNPIWRIFLTKHIIILSNLYRKSFSILYYESKNKQTLFVIYENETLKLFL